MQILKYLSQLGKPKGKVRVTLTDLTTGSIEVVEKKQSFSLMDWVDDLLQKDPQFKELMKNFYKNTATYDARKVAAHLLKGDSDWAAAQIEWGWGDTAATRADTDIAGPFDPRVLTDINAFSFPTSDENILKINSSLTTEVLNFPLGGPESPYPFVRELGLRTLPIEDPDNEGEFLNSGRGFLIARFVLDLDIPKPSAQLHIGAEWLYAYN